MKLFFTASIVLMAQVASIAEAGAYNPMPTTAAPYTPATTEVLPEVVPEISEPTGASSYDGGVPEETTPSPETSSPLPSSSSSSSKNGDSYDELLDSDDPDSELIDPAPHGDETDSPEATDGSHGKTGAPDVSGDYEDSKEGADADSTDNDDKDASVDEPETPDTAKPDEPMPEFQNGGKNLHPYEDDVRDYIVEAHNNARANLCPTEAANMRALRWDESLAIEASELVNSCVFEHATKGYGQNLVYGGAYMAKELVDTWLQGWVADELTDADREGGGYMTLNHASAVLWADTFAVGCASNMCADGYMTACNYFNPGNYEGEQAYVPGKACSQCPSEAPLCDASGKLCMRDPSASPQDSPYSPYSPPTEPELEHESESEIVIEPETEPTQAPVTAAPTVPAYSPSPSMEEETASDADPSPVSDAPAREEHFCE